MKRVVLEILILFCLFGELGHAQEEIVERAQNEAELKKMANEMNASCESSIAVRINWDSFAKSEWRDYSVYSFCGAPLESLLEFCSAENGNSKAYIQKNVTRIICSYGGEGKRALVIKNGTINNIVDFEASNLDKFIHAALVKNL
jgi:hypothetical protein